MRTASHSRILRTIPLLIAVCLTAFPAYAKYGGGSGTGEDPYQIATAEDLMLLGESPEDYDRQFVLTADIDLDPNLPGRRVFDRAVIADGWFTGVFDGGGHRIANLAITGADFLGLFGTVAPRAEVKDLRLVDVTIDGDRCVGGLAGSNRGLVTRCLCTGTVNGRGDELGGVGGVVGTNEGGRVSLCCSTATVCRYPEGMHVGGLVGINDDGDVIRCYSRGDVGGNQRAGGLVGYNTGVVYRCYSTGAVLPSSESGGLVGLGGGGPVIQSFWDIDSSQRSASGGGTGLTTAKMQDVRTYLDAGWDWVDENSDGTSQVWQMPAENSYPVLAVLNGYAPPKVQGVGTPDAPYVVSNPSELGAMVYYSPYAHYRLGASIDLSGICWSTAVVPWFAGRFDGNGLTISYLNIEGEQYLGLFGALATGAEVLDLGVVDVNIVSSSEIAGSLAGINRTGCVTRCYSTGTVTGNKRVGGLIGMNSCDKCEPYSAQIAQCYSTATVSGSETVGGLIGSTLTYVIQCFSAGSVTGDRDVGGLVGSAWSDIVTASFWDVEASGQSTSARGTGKTTVEMKRQSTFEGWDFINVWGIGENQTYPYLRKYSAADINQDERVNFGDLAILAENWLSGVAP